MTEQNKILRIGVITAAVVGTLGIPATAFAANTNDIVARFSEATAAQHAQIGGDDFAHPSHDRGRGGQQGPRAEEHLAKLAASLNISVDTLKAAIAATRTELKDQRPEGRNDRPAFEVKYLTTLASKLNISVDALKTAMKQAQPQRPERGERHEKRSGHFQALATALGVTPEALKDAIKEARQETKPATRPADDAARRAQHDAFIAALAAKLNVSVDKVKAALEQARPPKADIAEHRAMLQRGLAQMVKNERITQAQADQILADLDAGKPVGEVLRQFMPRLGDGDRNDRNDRNDRDGDRDDRRDDRGRGHGREPRGQRGNGA